MRVARLHGVGDIRLADEPAPEVGQECSLVRVTAVGLCGSDLHWFTEGGIGDARLRRPLVLGHEFAGVVEGGPRSGERVALDPAIPCERCEMCLEGTGNLCPDVEFAGHSSRDGALRELVAWPTRHLYPLPDSLTDADGAMLEPLGVAIHAVDLGHVPLGSTVGLAGCGPIGLCLLQAARVSGATTVVAADPLPHRREAARRLGADVVVDPADVAGTGDAEALFRGLGADVTFDASGSDDAVELALRMARPGARVVLAGIPERDATSFRASVARRKGLTLVMVRRMKDVYARATHLVERGHIEVASIVTDRFPLADVEQAFRTAATRNGLKVVVEPSAPASSRSSQRSA